jgi:transcriptional regulator GlxA family with amidase domain
MNMRVAFVAFEDMQPIDLTGPLQVISSANDVSDRSLFDISVFSLLGGVVPLRSGLQLNSEAFDRKELDMLVVPGGPGVHEIIKNDSFVDQITKADHRAEVVMSVCTGAFALAQAGFLDGRSATTHWRTCDQLQTQFPKVTVRPDKLWVEDGKYWTSGGMTAGIDMMLAWLQANVNKSVANQVAKRMLVHLRRESGQSQFSDLLQLQSYGRLSKLVEAIQANPGADWSVESLADAAAMSARTLHRKCAVELNVTPAKLVEAIRISQARILIETTNLPFSEVAQKAGLGNEYNLRQSCRRKFGLSPKKLRERF